VFASQCAKLPPSQEVRQYGIPAQPSGLICGIVLRFDAPMPQAKQATMKFALHWQNAGTCPRQFAFADPLFAAWGRAG